MENQTKNTLPPDINDNDDSFITKKMADLSIVIGSLLFLSILVFIYKRFGLKILSNTLFLISIYILVLSLVFFTIGLYTEKKVIKKNIDFVLDKTLSIIKPRKLLHLTKKQEDDLNEQNELIKNDNNKIIMKASISFGLFVLVTLILSIIIWKYTKSTMQEFKQFIIIKNSIILVFVIIVQIIFYLFVIGENRPIGLYDLILKLLEKLNKN